MKRGRHQGSGSIDFLSNRSVCSEITIFFFEGWFDLEMAKSGFGNSGDLDDNRGTEMA